MKIYTILFNLFVLAGAMLLYVSCDRSRLEGHVGPSVCATDNFKFTRVFTVPSDTLNLADSSANILATFNEVIPWKVKITGQTSGVLKTFEGNSREVAIVWTGRSEEGYSFFIKEVCMVELTVACKQPIVNSFAITPNSFLNESILISNFDGAGHGKFANPPYGVNKDNAASGIKSDAVEASPQGGSYYRIVGNSGTTPVWFFGGTWTFLNLKTLSVSDPSKVYFNIFMNSNGSKNADISFVFRENGISKTYRKTVDWEGWKMLSFPLSEAGITEVKSVSQVDIGLGSAPEQGTSAEINFDFVIITENTPFYE